MNDHVTLYDSQYFWLILHFVPTLFCRRHHDRLYFSCVRMRVIANNRPDCPEKSLVIGPFQTNSQSVYCARSDRKMTTTAWGNCRLPLAATRGNCSYYLMSYWVENYSKTCSLGNTDIIGIRHLPNCEWDPPLHTLCRKGRRKPKNPHIYIHYCIYFYVSLFKRVWLLHGTHGSGYCPVLISLPHTSGDTDQGGDSNHWVLSKADWDQFAESRWIRLQVISSRPRPPHILCWACHQCRKRQHPGD